MIRAMLETADVLTRIAREDESDSLIDDMAQAIVDCSHSGGTVFVFGNGGSAADADHFVGELLGQEFGRYKTPIRAQTLSNETAAMTAISNDKGSSNWPGFLVAFMSANDLVLLLSTSFKDHTGFGSNVVKMVDACRGYDRPPTLMAIAGNKIHASGIDLGRFDHVFVIPSLDVQIVQEVTMAVLHEIMRRVNVKLGG